jgi:hypothetical protein
MMANRRSAERSARLDAGLGAFGETTLGTFARAALTVTRPVAGFRAAGVLGDDFFMIYI